MSKLTARAIADSFLVDYLDNEPQRAEEAYLAELMSRQRAAGEEGAAATRGFWDALMTLEAPEEEGRSQYDSRPARYATTEANSASEGALSAR